MGNAISSCLKNYANFTGRSKRSEYWFFVLFTFLVDIAATVIDAVLGTDSVFMGYGTVYTICSLAFFIPTLAVAVRRMHDLGKSGWFIVIPIYNIVLLATDSEKVANKYGEVIS